MHRQTNQVMGRPTSKEHIWLSYRRYRHLLFSYLHKLFPYLFSKGHVYNFHCNSCMLVKHHQTSFTSSLNKILLSFSNIHSDVWGSSPITNHSSFKWFVYFLLMIAFVFHGSIFWNKKVIFFFTFKSLIKWLYPN